METSAHLILKAHARSLCPVCCREIPATVREESDGVYLNKQCGEHGSFRSMVERDAPLYKALMNPVPRDRKPITLVIPVTHRCNLRCKLCYYPNSQVPDPPQESIRRLIDTFPGSRIVFSGGEPSLREDLPELIGYANSKGKNTCMATNGVSLSHRPLIERLADAGLRSCLFSMNGLSDDVFKHIEGVPLYNKKLKGLENLCRTPVTPLLSSTLVPGVNESKLPELARFLLLRSNAFHVWRLRAYASIGRHEQAEPLWMSDVFRLTCDALGLDRSALLASLDTESMYHGSTHFYAIMRCKVGKASDRPSSASVDARACRMEPGLSARHERKEGHDRRSEPPQGGGTFLPRVGQAVKRALERADISHRRIRMFAWPSIYNVDLDEVSQTGVWHVGPGGEPRPFVEAIIRNNHQPDWNWT